MQVAEGRGVEPLTVKPPRYSTPIASQPSGTFRKWCSTQESNLDRRRLQLPALPFELVLLEIRAGIEPASVGLQPTASPLCHLILKWSSARESNPVHTG